MRRYVNRDTPCKTALRGIGEGKKGITVVTAGKARRLGGIASIESALRRKQIPLCKEHHQA